MQGAGLACGTRGRGEAGAVADADRPVIGTDAAAVGGVICVVPTLPLKLSVAVLGPRSPCGVTGDPALRVVRRDGDDDRGGARLVAEFGHAHRGGVASRAPNRGRSVGVVPVAVKRIAALWLEPGAKPARLIVTVSVAPRPAPAFRWGDTSNGVPPANAGATLALHAPGRSPRRQLHRQRRVEAAEVE